jgi:hypothetical protein
MGRISLFTKRIFIDANEILIVVIICKQIFSFCKYTSYKTI